MLLNTFDWGDALVSAKSSNCEPEQSNGNLKRDSTTIYSRIIDSQSTSLANQVKPYVYSVLLFLASCAIMWLGNTLLLEYAFPWSLFALIVVGAAAIFWGNKPAVLVLALSVLFSGIFLPDLRSAHFHANVLSTRIQMLRMPLFALCGGTVIWLTHQSRLIQKRAEKRKSVVEALQHMTLPATLPLIPGYEISSVYRPARIDEAVSGDFYDCFMVRDAIFGILIGDVVGKGKEATISTALLRYSVRSFASLGMTPSQVLSSLTRLLENQNVNFQTATLFFALLDSASGELTYSSAGHEPPLHMLASGGFEHLESGGPLLGIGDQFKYDEGAIHISKGDRILMMTDGVTEARTPQGEFLGSRGVLRFMQSIPKQWTMDQAINQLDSLLANYTSGNYRDDVAMLLLMRTV
jgi:serine phosphatase RsbU (regulator of sigma subunit)